MRTKEKLPRIVALLFVLALMVPGAARAQANLTLSAVQVDLWPEFDRPSMLVIYHITLPAQGFKPTDLSFSIPAAVGKPNAVAAKQPDGTLISLSFDQQTAADWSVIKFTATTPESQIEYYDPSLKKQGSNRSFEYQWHGDYAVDSFVVSAQQPVDASNLTISPGTTTSEAGKDGLTYFTRQIGALAAGQPFTLQVGYQKSTDTLSTNVVKPQPSAPITEETAGRITTLTSFLPWALGILGILLIVGGGVWYWQSGRQKERPAKRLRHRPAVAEREPEPVQGNVYCHQCGKRAAPGDQFCRTCGARLRVS